MSIEKSGRGLMRLETLQKEVESFAHTLNDMKTIIKCYDDLKKNIGPRIERLEQRVDRFAIAIDKERQYQKERENNDRS